jgi:hypothetical protein
VLDYGLAQLAARCRHILKQPLRPMLPTKPVDNVVGKSGSTVRQAAPAGDFDTMIKI